MKLSTMDKTENSPGIVIGCSTRSRCFSNDLMEKCVESALENLKINAKKLGADEVIGIKIVQSFENDIFYVTAIGTAVREKQLTIPKEL